MTKEKKGQLVLLKKIEKLSRRLEIEEALDRIRGISHSMIASEYLQQVLQMINHQIDILGLESDQIFLFRFEPKQYNKIISWEHSDPGDIYIETEWPAFKHTFRDQLTIARKRRRKLLTNRMQKGIKNSLLRQLYRFTPVTEQRREFALGASSLHTSIALDTHVGIALVRFEQEPLTKGQNDTLKRITKVFNQSFTRFLDLQKAEAQDREAQIEVALERIRTQTIVMHSSGELSSIINNFYRELTNLDLKLDRCMLLIVNSTTEDITWWFAGKEGLLSDNGFLVKNNNYPSHKAYIDGWRKRKDKWQSVFEGSEKKAWDKYAFSKTSWSNLPLIIQKEMSAVKKVHLSISSKNFGNLVAGTMSPLSDNQHHLISRFAKVFDQTYTRFLDLQRAESQVREAQIDAAIERVRAISLAMHKSDELQKVILIIFQQLKALEVTMDVSYIEIFDETLNTNMWVANPQHDYAQQVSIPKGNNLMQSRMSTARQKKEPFFNDRYNKNEKNKFYRHAFKSSEMRRIPEKLQKQILNRDGYARSVALSKYASIGIINLDGQEYSIEENKILQNFSKVFNQAYTRFLDLQKAESQTRELAKVFQENERLLHNILPISIAEQLKKSSKTVVQRFDNVSILFADLVGFTVLSDKLSPQKVVDLLNDLFSKFDDLTDRHGIEKIKTIGDAYMVAAGVPEEINNPAKVLFSFAQDMLRTLRAFNESKNRKLELRIGLSSGPVVAGVIGKKKFTFDLWGDTVNTAARMESYGKAGSIQVAPSTYHLLKDDYEFQKIPNVRIKGKGIMDVYLWQE